MRIWAKLIIDNRIIKQAVVEAKDNYPIDLLHQYLTEISYKLDIETPILLSKHKTDMLNFRHTKFDKFDFIDKFKCDKLLIENIE